MADDYYSKKNPLGPWRGTIRPNAPAPKPSDYIEGFPTKKNLSEWATYATRNSNPNLTSKKSKGE